MPSLKPLTALPRSLPMLRSFFVPKMRTTTSNTISQCQMLNEPIICAPKLSRSPGYWAFVRVDDGAGASRARALFLDAGSAFAPGKLREHLFRTRAVPGQQDHGMKPEICGFAYEMQFITVLRGKQ